LDVEGMTAGSGAEVDGAAVSAVRGMDETEAASDWSLRFGVDGMGSETACDRMEAVSVSSIVIGLDRPRSNVLDEMASARSSMSRSTCGWAESVRGLQGRSKVRVRTHLDLCWTFRSRLALVRQQLDPPLVLGLPLGPSPRLAQAPSPPLLVAHLGPRAHLCALDLALARRLLDRECLERTQLGAPFSEGRLRLLELGRQRLREGDEVPERDRGEGDGR